MNTSILRNLIKSKIIQNKDLEKLIDEFVAKVSNASASALKEELSSLLVFIKNHIDKIDKHELLELIEMRLKNASIPFEFKELEALYTNIAKVHGASLALLAGIKPLKFSFDRTDIEAIKAMRENFYWIGREYNENFQKRLKGVIEKAFKGEIPRLDLALALKSEFEDMFNHDRHYFKGVADHIILQNQNIARIIQANKYGVKHYKIVATMDAKTSAICRSMHGRIIEAKRVLNQVEQIINAKTMADKKSAATWRSEPFIGKDLPPNLATPPFHFRCRTMIVPVWLREEDHGDFKSKSSIIDKKGLILAHIDKTGVERVLDSKAINGDHGLAYRWQSGEIDKNKIVRALNSIKLIAPSKNYENRLNALSANGLVLVFEADRIITAFESDKDYFKRHSITNKQEIIKRW